MVRMMADGPIILDHSPKKKHAGKYFFGLDFKKTVYSGGAERAQFPQAHGLKKNMWMLLNGNAVAEKYAQIIGFTTHALPHE